MKNTKQIGCRLLAIGYQLSAKKLTIYLLITILSSCGFFEDKSKKTLPDANVYTLVFIDKTQSVNTNKAFVEQKYKEILATMVEENIRQKGDRVELYYIHENTAKAKALTLNCRTLCENTDAMNATDREAATTTFDMAIARERMVFLRQILAKLSATNGNESRQHTDIWGSLPIIAKAIETGADVKVYYLSDMVESMKGLGRRDFHTNPPKDSPEAENWAKDDAKSLKTNNLGASQIKMALPFEATSSRSENNPNITTYWNALFQELGAGSIEEI